MTHIDNLTLEAADPAAAELFYKTAFGLQDLVRVREAEQPSEGFRAFTVSLLTKQPADVDLLVAAALDAGATAVKPAAKSLWGYGAVLQTPDGSIWKVATPKKKNTADPSASIEQIVLLLGCADLAATKRFYVGHGLTVARSFGKKYAEFEQGSGKVTLGLYGRKALAKDAGVPPEGTGSHRLVINGGTEPFTDPDGFAWEPADR